MVPINKNWVMERLLVDIVSCLCIFMDIDPCRQAVHVFVHKKITSHSNRETEKIIGFL